MNKSLNVFLIVLLCFVLYAGVLTSLYTTDDSASQHYQTEYTSSIPTGIGAPSVSFGVGARGNDLTVPMSSRPSRGSVRHLSSHRLVTSSPNSLTSSPNSLITYTSSSQTMKSFGGGNSAGVSMSGGTVRNDNSATSVASANIAYAPLPAISVPYTYVYTPDENQGVAASVYSGAPAMVNDHYPFSSYSSQITYNATNTATSLLGNPLGLRGRLSAPTLGDPWWNWLSDWVGETGYAGTGKEGSDGFDYYFDRYKLQDAYKDFINNYWDSSLGAPPSFSEWLDWFMSSTGNDGYQMGDDTYHWLPVGDVWPLVVMLLFYAGYVFVRKRKQLKVNA